MKIMFTLVILLGLLISCSDNKTASIDGFTVSGTIFYQEETASNVIVQLVNESRSRYSTLTDENGYFEFSNVESGDYTLTATNQLENDVFSESSVSLTVDDDIELDPLILPEAIFLFNPTNTTDLSTTLTWTSSEAQDFAEYKLFRHFSSGLDETTGTLIHVSTVQTDTMFIDTTLSPSTIYYYRIYVMSNYGRLGGSNIVSTTTDETHTIPPVIDEDLIIINEYSPYIIDYDIFVEPNVTLTIEPGTELRFSKVVSTNSNGWSLYPEIIVSGTLIAEGNESSEIIFTSNEVDPSVEDWGGIIAPFNQDEGAFISLKYSIIEYFDNGLIDTDYYMYPFIVEFCLFRYGNIGINGNTSTGGIFNINNNTFEYLDIGCDLSEISWYVESIHNNTFRYNNIGLSFTDAGSTPINYNNFIGNIIYAVSLDYCQNTVNMEYNYWDVFTLEEIEELINNQSQNEVDVIPWLTEPVPVNP